MVRAKRPSQTEVFSYSLVMDLLDMLLDDMHLRGARMVEWDCHSQSRVCVPAAPCAYFHVVLSGEVRLQWANGGETLLMQRGDVLVLPSGIAHDLGEGPEVGQLTFADAPEGLVSFGVNAYQPRVQMLSGQAQFDAELARPFMTALPQVLRIPGEAGELPPWIAIGLQFIRQELRAELPARQAVVNRMSDILFIECLRRFVARIPEDEQTWLRALLDPALSRALAALHADPAHNWSVESLAREANLSRSAFAHRFRQCLGQTPIDYLTAHRLRRAAWQLRHTAQPVARIAEAAGYASSSAFTQAFDRRYGVSPRRYRDADQAPPEPLNMSSSVIMVDTAAARG